MTTNTSQTHCELVLAIVAPVGVNLDGLTDSLARSLKRLEYVVREHRLSTLISDYAGGEPPPVGSEAKRLDHFMRKGNEVRERHGNEGVARMALAKISGDRPRAIDADGTPSLSDLQVLKNTAHLIISLKRPEEVHLLRRVYSSSLTVIGVYASKRTRRQVLMDRQITSAEAEALIERDEQESGGCGQATRLTYELADAFLPSTRNGVEEKDLGRLVDLLFGSPTITPTPAEYGMFVAYSASLCSASLSRQVGAAIVRGSADIVSTGRNDVPKNEGGCYWPGHDDERDHIRGFDPNDREKQRLVVNVARRLNPERWKESPDEKVSAEALQILKGSELLAITEFGRDVHAEMDALLTAARLGSSTSGATLYTTTFPCHNCAKHIVSAGIEKVVYVEPYPKSRAASMFPDTIAIDEEGASDKVVFEPFVGIGPRKFFDLFSMRMGNGYEVKRKENGVTVEWPAPDQAPRTSFRPSSYIERESMAADELRASLAETEGEA